MFLVVGALSAGLLILTAGAEALVKGGASLARRLGVSPLAVGLTIIAFGTSAPELVVSLMGAMKGHSDVAVGNVVGSNIFNVGAILGIAALLKPLRVAPALVRMDAPIMAGVSLLAALALTFAFLGRPGGVSFVLMLIVYTTLSLRGARNRIGPDVQREFDVGTPRSTRSLGRDIFLIAGGLGLLVAGSNLLVNNALTMARRLGVDEAVIGLTIVAGGTSMPELATAVVAVVRKHSDLAVGTVIGSNIFNLLGILGLTAVLSPLKAPGVGELDVWTMVGFAVLLIPLLWSHRTVGRWEGALLLAGYVSYVWFRWMAR